MDGHRLSEWERCKHWLEAALDDTHTIEDVRRDIEAGRAQFWPLHRGAAVTVVHDYPARSVLRIWLAGGDLDELVREIDTLDEYARRKGCTAIEIEGRKGWGRVLSDYRVVSVILRRDL